MTTLRLISRQQETFEEAFRQQIESFDAAHPNVRVECKYLPIHDHFELMVEGEGTRSGQYDLFLCCTDWLPSLIHEGKIRSLSDELHRNPPADWPEGWHPAMRGLIASEGTVYAFPWHDGPEVLHYRSDLFESETERANFLASAGRELVPPRTWEEFLEVAKFFTRPEEGLWGCCEAAYNDGHNDVYDFLIQLWSRGGELIDADGNVRFDEQPGIDGLQFYVDLFQRHKVAPTECLNLGSVECGDFYAQGHAAMSWNWVGFAAVAEIPQMSKIVGKNRCTALPHDISLNIFWGLTIPVSSPNAELAYQFIRHIAQPSLDKVTSMVGANGVRLSTWRDPEVRAKYPHYAVIEEVHAGTRTLPAIPEYPAINEAISRAVRDALRGADISEVLRRAAEEAREILRVSQ